MAHTPINSKYTTYFNNGNDNGGELLVQASLVGTQPNPPKENYYQYVVTSSDSQNVETAQLVFYLNEKSIADLIKQLTALISAR